LFERNSGYLPLQQTERMVHIDTARLQTVNC